MDKMLRYKVLFWVDFPARGPGRTGAGGRISAPRPLQNAGDVLFCNKGTCAQGPGEEME